MSRILFVLMGILFSVSGFSQIIEDILEIRDASELEFFLFPGEFIKDSEGNFYCFQPKSRFRHEETEGGLLFNGEKIDRGPILDSIGRWSEFIYVIKLSPDFELLASNVLKNVRHVENISANEGHFSIAISGEGSYPLMVGDTIIERPIDGSSKWVVVFDEDLELVESINMPTSTTLAWASLGKEPGELFLGIDIKDDTEYIVYGSDTLWNYRYESPITPNYYFHPPTGVIAGYNYTTREYQWIRKFGGEYGGSQIRQIEIDAFGDVVGLFWGGTSPYFYIDDREDSIPSSGRTLDRAISAESALVKLSPTGEYLWGAATPEARYDIMIEMSLDADGNIYMIGHHSNDSLVYRDTVLHSQGDDLSGFERRGITAKFNRDGTFGWVHQLSGAYSYCYNYNINAISSDYIYISELCRHGEIVVGDSIFELDVSLWNYEITCRVGKDGKSEELIVYSEGSLPRTNDIIALDNDRVILMYRSIAGEEFFGQDFGSPGRTIFLKLNLIETVSSDDLVYRRDDFSMYPNPVERGGQVNLAIDKGMHHQKMELKILGMDGRELWNKTGMIGEGGMKIDLPPGLSSSAYILLLLGEEGVSGKILVVK